MHTLKLSTLAAAIVALVGCASLPPGMNGQYPSSPLRYTQPQAQTVQQVELGKVVTVRHVTIDTDATRAALGSGIGALAGGLLGHQIGAGKGKTLATVAGAAAGAVGGNMVATHAYRQPGLAITLQIFDGQPDAGRVFQITQAVAPGVSIHAEDRVEVVNPGCYSGGWCPSPARVIPLPASDSDTQEEKQ